jgi:hypothetical protein
MKRGLGRRIDGRTDVASCHRIGGAVKNLPALQGADIDLVERDKAAFGKRGRGPQLAGAERRQRSSCRADDLLDPAKSLVERNRLAELNAYDAVPRHRRDTGRILEHAFDKAIAAGLERLRWHSFVLRAAPKQPG